jgi:hypothetical protein
MLGGMWGYANYRNRDIGINLLAILKNETIANVFNINGTSLKGLDQDFLKLHFWPTASLNSLIHDSYFCKTLGGDPFPTQRSKIFCFVPCAYCCDENIYNKTWLDECPHDCRPNNHKDWQYC